MRCIVQYITSYLLYTNVLKALTVCFHTDAGSLDKPPQKPEFPNKSDNNILDDNYDSLTEARSILSGWLNKKDEINYDVVVGAHDNEVSCTV